MNVAFIPVRGGSKSIPHKNIKYMCGRPLVYWTVKAACECKYIDTVYVATDCYEIKNAVDNFILGNETFDKVQIIGRSAESASDTAPTEYAMLEFAEKYNFDNIVLIQATSPLLTGEDLDGGFELFYQEGTDSVLSVVRQYRFLWDKDKKGSATPFNYDVYCRPRRQDFAGYLVENGAFYITSRKGLLQSKNRVSGNIRAYEMSEDSFLELDSPDDWTIVETLMRRKGLDEKKDYIPTIKIFLTDCDGCLTDAGMYYSEFGDELKKFNTKDGMGFSLLHDKGIMTGIVTKESVQLNRRRAEKMKVDIFEEGCQDKAVAIKQICDKYNISTDNVVYVGDDVNDIEAIQMVGFGCCPADAVQPVKNVADYVTMAKGGEGVIREVVDMILQ